MILEDNSQLVSVELKYSVTSLRINLAFALREKARMRR